MIACETIDVLLDTPGWRTPSTRKYEQNAHVRDKKRTAILIDTGRRPVSGS